MNRVTEIWFKTKLKLKGIADYLNNEDNFQDCENYWEWVEFNFNGFRLNITRTYQASRNKTDTRIFLLGNTDSFSDELIQEICQKLVELKIKKIHLGYWVPIPGTRNRFNKTIIANWLNRRINIYTNV